jgi:hypothetical protein
MTLSVLLSIYGVLALFSCVVYMGFPSSAITLYGGSVDPQATLLLRLVGGLFGGFGLMAWLGRNAAPSDSRNAMALGLALSNALAAGVAVTFAVSGIYNQFAWGPAVTCALFAAGFLLVRR